MKTDGRLTMAPEDPSRQATDWRTAIGLAYIALPNVLFLCTWVKPALGIPIAIALAFALWKLLSEQAKDGEKNGIRLSVIITVIVVTVLWAAFGGAGHIGFANFDWRTRDAVYGDLIRYSWPVAYYLPDNTVAILRTAMAYYLPAAAVAKQLGIQYADALLFTWTALGTAIFLIQLPVPRARSGLGWIAPLIIVIMFSGMDALGTWLDDLYYWPGIPDHLEWWANRFQYSSMSTQLFWVPNHALAAWIAAALFFRHYKLTAYSNQAALTLAMLPLWSPFAALGFAPFAGLALWQRLQRERSTGLTPLNVVTTAALVYITGRLLTSGAGDIPVGTTLATGATSDTAEFISYYVLFVLLEFGALTAVLAYRIKGYTDLLWLSGLTLLVLPFARLGPGNDIVMRASIPALTLLCLLTVVAVTRPANPMNRRASTFLLTAILAIGSITAIHEMSRTLIYKSWPANYNRTLREQQQGHLPYHYVGRFDNADLKWLMKPPESIY